MILWFTIFIIIIKLLFFFCFMSFPEVFLYVSFKRSWKLKRSEATPTETYLSKRKPCSSNISSEAPPLIPGLCDITMQHSCCNACLVASLARKIGLALLL